MPDTGHPRPHPDIDTPSKQVRCQNPATHGRIPAPTPDDHDPTPPTAAPRHQPPTITTPRHRRPPSPHVAPNTRPVTRPEGGASGLSTRAGSRFDARNRPPTAASRHRHPNKAGSMPEPGHPRPHPDIDTPTKQGQCQRPATHGRRPQAAGEAGRRPQDRRRGRPQAAGPPERQAAGRRPQERQDRTAEVVWRRVSACCAPTPAGGP